MDTADDLALQQNQEEAQRSKYALLRPSAPLGSECLVRVFFLDSLDQPQQLVVASTVPVERVQDRSVEIRHAVEAFLRTLCLQPLSLQLEVFTTKPMAFGGPAPPRPGAGISSTALSGVVYGCPPVQARQGQRNWHTAGVHDTAWPRPGTWHHRLSL